MKARLYNDDCITGAKQIETESIDLGIHDPPFGLGEGSFGSQYNRKKTAIIKGYVEAPEDYEKFSFEWIAEAARVLKPTGTLYIVSGWSWERDVLNAVAANHLLLLNKIIWEYPFGVYCKKQFVSSHYEILRCAKTDGVKFNKGCRYSTTKEQYADMQDVWHINKEYHRSVEKNCNKLPTELVRKMIQYSSDPGDTVADFFLGNGTTADCCYELDRDVIGFEINLNAFTRIQQRMLGNGVLR